MGKADLADQGFLRHQRERRENPDLDCGARLPAGRHHEEATQNRGQSLRNFTGSECLLVRENRDKSAAYKIELQMRTGRNR